MTTTSVVPATTAPLFTPFTLGSVQLSNRFVMAPMTRKFSPNGVPGPDVAAYYARRAQQGVGLIITEGTTIGHVGASNHPDVPNLHQQEALSGWERVVREVHEAGGKIFSQLWHVGLDPLSGDLLHPGTPLVGPSGVIMPEYPPLKDPMTESEIADVIAAYAQAASNARTLGFDGIELHAGHGYLIDQFFWEGTNRRTDRYGGDIAGRTRFAVEVIEACRAAVGPNFPIVLRFSQWKTADFTVRLAAGPEQLEQFLTPMTAAGIDAYHCSTRRYWQPEFEGSELGLAGWTRKISGKPVIMVGSVGLDDDYVTMFAQGTGAGTEGIGGVVDRLQRNEFDLVAVGRALLGDPAWVAKLREGRVDEFQPFDISALGSLA